MDKYERNKLLNIIGYASLYVSSWKCKRKIVYRLLEFLYCLVISFVPRIIIMLVCVFFINKNENINIYRLLILLILLFIAPMFYFIISNVKNDNNIEDYVFKGALYIDEYITDKNKIKLAVGKFVGNLSLFWILFMVLFVITALLLKELGLLSIENYVPFFIIQLFCTYGLFVYGSHNNDTREKRKEHILVIIAFGWLVVVYIRTLNYLNSIESTELFDENLALDLFLLLFSVIFTVPTLYDWMKNIPKRLLEKYSNSVDEREKKITESYHITMKKKKEDRLKTFNELKKAINACIAKLKNVKKRKLLKFLIYGFSITIAIAGLTIVIINRMGDASVNPIDKLCEFICFCYANLDYRIKLLFGKILALLFIILLLWRTKCMIANKCSSKESNKEKLIYISTFIILDILIVFFISKTYIL